MMEPVIGLTLMEKTVLFMPLLAVAAAAQCPPVWPPRIQTCLASTATVARAEDPQEYASMPGERIGVVGRMLLAAGLALSAGGIASTLRGLRTCRAGASPINTKEAMPLVLGIAVQPVAGVLALMGALIL